SGDRDGDGFVEYDRKRASGLRNQGWKDSDDSVFHADGSLATGPIALCEVQGYVYLAYRVAARLAADMDDYRLSAGLTLKAETLGADSRRPSGTRSSAPMRLRSTATSAPAWGAPRTPDSCWSPALPPPSRRPAWGRGCS